MLLELSPRSLKGTQPTAATSEPVEALIPVWQRPQYETLFYLVLSLYCLWVLSLPVFPSQDGGMHLYYVNALKQVHAGNGLYQHSYILRLPLPPYSVQYGVLYGLTSLMDFVWAEKVVVCLILIATATGFRSLARLLGPAGDLFSLFIFPLALGWALFMGYHNFCLSLGFSLWALSFWLRAAAGNRRYFGCFLLALLVVEFTHPVPLLILIAVVSVDLTLRVLKQRIRMALSLSEILRIFRMELVSLSTAIFLAGYLALFVNGNKVDFTVQEAIPFGAAMTRLVSLQFMCIGTACTAARLFRCFLFLLLVASLWLGWMSFRRSWRLRQTEASSTMLVCAIGLLCLLPAIPSRVNGLDGFRERLMIYCFLFALAAACSYRGFSRRTEYLVRVGALLFTGFDLAMAERLIRPVAQELAQVETGSKHTSSQNGILLNASRIIGPRHLSANPYHIWNGARFFRRSNMLLLNDPWAGPPNILPVNRTSDRLNSELSNFELLNPIQLYRELVASQSARQRILSQTNFVFFVGVPHDDVTIDPLLSVSGRFWDCKQGQWFFYCEANQHGKKNTLAMLQNSTLKPVTSAAANFKFLDDPIFVEAKQSLAAARSRP